MNVNNVCAGIAALCLACILAPAGIQARAGGDEGIPGFTKELTAKQQEVLRRIWAENASARKALRKELAAKRGELNELMKSGNPDFAKIEAVSTEIGALRGKMLVEGAATHAKVAKAGLPVGEMKFRDRGGRYDKNNLAPRLSGKLTAEEKAKGEKILAANAAARDEINGEIMAKRGELAKLMKAENPDNAKIESLSAEIGGLRGKMLVDRIKLRDQLKQAGLPANCLEPGGKAAPKKRPKKTETQS